LLVHVTARGFRNLEPLTWQPAPGSHLLLGGNGAGKTSLLEAVYVLATTRSFRTPHLADCVRHGEESFAVEGEVESGRRCRLMVAWRGGERQRAINGKSRSLAEHLAALPVAAWHAGEADVLTGTPGARRRFLDRGVVGVRPAALAVLSRYRAALLQKRQLLAAGGEGLEAWNELVAAAAAEVIQLRQAYFARLEQELAAVVEAAGLPLAEVTIRYRPSPASGLAGGAEIAASLARMADRERRRQMPLVGPQRDDVEVLLGGNEVRRVASAGERKALSLLLLAAHGRVLAAAGREPLYLLDDADTELAPPALTALWRVFAGARQLIATSNRPQVWLALEVGRIWQVEKGRLTSLDPPAEAPGGPPPESPGEDVVSH
jgi:DNA replication and repair protein RecF